MRHDSVSPRFWLDASCARGCRLIGDLSDSEKVLIGLHVSIGLTVSTGGRGGAEGQLHEADTAMYQAKSLGGRRVQVFDAAVGHELARWADAPDMIQLALDE